MMYNKEKIDNKCNFCGKEINYNFELEVGICEECQLNIKEKVKIEQNIKIKNN